MNTAAILFLALLLDATFGEPRWLWQRVPHPAVLMGRLIDWADRRFNTGPTRRMNGVLVVIGLVIGAGIAGTFVAAFGWLPQVLVAAILLAHRSLVQHVQAVGDALRLSVGEGRRTVAKIVSRDTASMSESAIARSAIESGAENFSDGVIAPAFWFLIAGLPGLLIYKVINTADSMIGYRTDKHRDFGWAAARLDDVLNWVPARLSAALIALTHGRLSEWAKIGADARLHRSPNAGWPESAMARALNVAVAGPRSYDGEMQSFPYVHATGRKTLRPADVDASCRALWRSWGVAVAAVALVALV